MKTIHVQKTSSAPPERLWAIVSDLNRSAEVISGIKKSERLDDGDGFGIGTKWRETRVMFGKEATEEMEVTALDPGRSYTVFSAGRGANYTSTMSTEAGADGLSIVSMTFGAEPTGALSRIMGSTIGRLFEGATRRMIEQDLADIVAAAESS